MTYKAHCLNPSCGYEWYPNRDDPARCPRCCSIRWNNLKFWRRRAKLAINKKRREKRARKLAIDKIFSI